MSVQLGKPFARRIVAEWNAQLAAGAIDIVALVPMSMLEGRAKPMQSVNALFNSSRSDRIIEGYDIGAMKDAADPIVRKYVDHDKVGGIIRGFGWGFNCRNVDDGIEVRPGLAFYIATTGKMPPRNMITRLADQGPGKVDRPKVTQWRKGRKAMEHEGGAALRDAGWVESMKAQRK